VFLSLLGDDVPQGGADDVILLADSQLVGVGIEAKVVQLTVSVKPLAVLPANAFS
jgi:hypothetical protein